MIQKPVVILANGTYPSHPFPLKEINEAGSIICCDGSVNQLVKNGLTPHIIIGDLDSIDPSIQSRYQEKIIHIPDQAENDLRKAISWCEENNIAKSIILGATGKRDDHSLANIFSLLQFPSKTKYTLMTDSGIFSIAETSHQFKSFKGQQVSLFSTDPSIKITTTELKYNFILDTISTLYSGSLNESINNFFTLFSILVFLFFPI